MHTYICPQCGKSFHRKWKNCKFCSPECQGLARRVNRHVCKYCGGVPSTPSRLFCSRSCYDNYRAQIISDRHAALSDRACLHCGKIIDVTKTRAEFCDHDCKVAHKKAKPRECINCGTVFSAVKYNRTTKRFVSTTSGKTCSYKCQIEWIKRNPQRKQKISVAFRGKNHPNWQGGKASINKDSCRGPGWEKIAAKVRKRDGDKCTRCGKTTADNGRKMDVHHIIPFHNFTKARDANRMGNLISLCLSCHRIVENGIEGGQMVLPFAFHAREKRRELRSTPLT